MIDCYWDGETLVLVAESNHDHDGEALADEFSDTVAAYTPSTSGYRVQIRSVVMMGAPSVESGHCMYESEWSASVAP